MVRPGAAVRLNRASGKGLRCRLWAASALSLSQAAIPTVRSAMFEAIAIFFSLACVSTVFVAVGGVLTFRLAPEDKRPKVFSWLATWGLRGLLVPFAIWALMNLGLSWNLQPFMPAIQAAQVHGGPWFWDFISVMGVGLFVVSSYWTAVTLGWLLISAFRGTGNEARKDFRALSTTCFLALIIPAGIVLLLGGWGAAGMAATVMLAPIAGYGQGILNPKKVPPMYARAIARMKFGKYSEAEWEIIRELEKSEDDYEGWMMLAELYASQFHDLREAEQTILGICNEPKTTPSQLSVALHRLADWHLKLAQDPVAARHDLQMICDRLAGTHLAHMAQLRMNQLPFTREELREQQNAKPIPLPVLGDKLDELPPPPIPEVERQQAAIAAAACVERLKVDPNNVAAREKLANLFTERLNRPELGIEQLSLLLDMPDQAAGTRVEWLGQIAAWQIKYKGDWHSAKKSLERLVREFPDSAQALAARRRLAQLDQRLKSSGGTSPAPSKENP